MILPVNTLRASTQLVEREREEAFKIRKNKSQESHPGLDFENCFKGRVSQLLFRDNT
jgi:hypothetical protein